MNDKDLLIAGVGEWLSKVAQSILPQVNIPPTSSVGKMMSGFLGINPSSYNLWAELGFLITPTITSFVEPAMRKYLASIPDDQVKAMAMSYADAMLKQAQEKGYINLFGVQLGANAVEGLKTILQQKFNQTSITL
jgi:hypothetical protein